MAENEISRMELKLEGEKWNTVKLCMWKNGRHIEHEWSNVSKKTVMKLLNASSAPSVSDFESWLREETEAEKKKNGTKCDAVCVSDNWWQK